MKFSILDVLCDTVEMCIDVTLVSQHVHSAEVEIKIFSPLVQALGALCAIYVAANASNQCNNEYRGS